MAPSQLSVAVGAVNAVISHCAVKVVNVPTSATGAVVSAKSIIAVRETLTHPVVIFLASA